LREAYRVLKPGGALRLVEHVRADYRVLGSIQDALTPVWKLAAGGCNLNRDTLNAVEDAGFRVRSAQKRFVGILVGIDAMK
jgi:ubiquinone/menaquinone biosynthesis C-methylase UbiE